MAPGIALLLWFAPTNVDAGPPPVPVPEPAAGDSAEMAAADAGPPEGIPGVTVTAKVEPEPVPFGARFDLVVTIVRDRGLHLDVPSTLTASEGVPQAGEPRRVVEDLPAPPARVRETVRIPFMALALEDTSTPAFVLTAKDGATLEVPALPVRVADDPSLLMVPDAGPDADGADDPSAVQLEPAASTIAYRVADPRPWAVAAAFASALLAFAAVRAAQKRRRLTAPPPPPEPLVPPRPPHEVALERLEALLAAGLLQRGETAVFVERLMDEVLRDYLAARFSLHAEARTTRELVAELLTVSMPGLDVKLVEELLGDADLVKFAKAAIAAERAHAMAMRVKALVLATTPATTTNNNNNNTAGGA